MRAPLLGALAGLAGCSTCPSFAETEVLDPRGIASDGAIARARAAIGEFAAWTGREGVCVSEVRFADLDDDRKVLGSYDPDGTVAIDPLTPDVGETVFHELCHALDWHEDLSWPNRALFPDRLEQLDGRDAAREVFADRCELGPAPHTVRALLPGCAPPDPQADFLLAEVWSTWTPALRAVPFATTRRAITGLSPAAVYTGHPIAAPGAVYLQAIERQPDANLLSFARIDLASAAVTATIPGPTVSPAANVAVIGGDADPLVVVEDEDRIEAWRLRGEALAPADFPAELAGVSGGVLADGYAWVVAGLDGDTALARVDLATLAIERVPLPDAPGGPDARFLRATGGVLAAPWSDGLGRYRLARLALSDLAWTLDDAPAPIVPLLAAPTPDGRAALRWGAEVGDDVIVGFGIFDPRDGAWTIDAATCAEAAAGFAGDFVGTVDGRPLFFSWPDEDRGLEDHALVEVELP